MKYLVGVSGWACLLACMTVFSSLAVADEIRMKNGDILTGEIIKKETDKVLLRTTYAGEISILWSEVVSLESEKPLHIMLTDNSRFNSTLKAAAPGKAKVDLVNTADNTEISLSELQYINPSPEVSGIGMSWSGRINLGGTLTDGNTETEAFNLDTETIARSKYDRYTVGATINRAKSQDISTQFNSRGYMKYDHFISKKWYLYANSAFEHDKFRDIQLRSSIGAGSGYQIFEQPDMNLFVEGGLNYINTKYYLAESDDYPAARWSIKYDQLLLGRNTFFHEHEILAGLQNSSNILLLSKTGLRVPLSQQLHAAVQYDYNWTKNPSDDRKKADSALIFSLGYGW